MLLATACVVPQAQAQSTKPAPTIALENSIETYTDAVLLPTGQLGNLTFRNCAEPCKLRSLEVTGESKFFVGSSSVTVAEFNAYVRRTGQQFLMVFYKPDRPTVTRVMVYGNLQ
ncbi:MAG TPA: hypothetical protein VNR40_05095 [Steroidobacter sp.]|nr:hypothetical protein [Steroidobacter sp.]